MMTLRHDLYTAYLHPRYVAVVDDAVSAVVKSHSVTSFEYF